MQAVSVFSKCIKADLELASADKSSAIAQLYLRACRSAQHCCLALLVFRLSLSRALSVAKAWMSQAVLMQRFISVSSSTADRPGAPCARKATLNSVGEYEKINFVVTEVAILAQFYFMWCVFCLLYHCAWVRQSLPLVQLFKCVWYRITLWS